MRGPLEIAEEAPERLQRRKRVLDTGVPLPGLKQRRAAGTNVFQFLGLPSLGWTWVRLALLPFSRPD